jgi:hypothetical protein
MPLRLVNKNRTHAIQACDTTFHIISMSVREKEKLVYDLCHLKTDTNESACDSLFDVIAAAITSADGYDIPVRELLEQLEDHEQLRLIIRAIIDHCSLTSTESKNSLSSSAVHTPESAGNVEKRVAPDDDLASRTPMPMAE